MEKTPRHPKVKFAHRLCFRHLQRLHCCLFSRHCCADPSAHQCRNVGSAQYFLLANQHSPRAYLAAEVQSAQHLRVSSLVRWLRTGWWIFAPWTTNNEWLAHSIHSTKFAFVKNTFKCFSQNVLAWGFGWCLLRAGVGCVCYSRLEHPSSHLHSRLFL
jgi:hypothetical protein